MNLHEMKTSTKAEKADFLIINGKIVNVFTKEIIEDSIAITNGIIVGIGDYEANVVIDAEGKYISPGFIDSHVHIESSMVLPSEYARTVLPHGVTTVICDPHEIANVSGVDGIKMMLDASENIPLDVRIMLPSCVPATSLERGGAVLYAEHLEPFMTHPRVLGLAEVMDYPAVMSMEKQMIDKLKLAHAYQKPIDGHLAGLTKNEINTYSYAGISTDHECTNVQEVMERLRAGLFVAFREGSAARNLKDLLPAVNDRNAQRIMYCTDDKHLDDIIKEGSIDFCIRTAIKYGIDPVTAYSMATLNPATCYGLKQKGAIAPGYEASFVFLNDLELVEVTDVWCENEFIVKNKQNCKQIKNEESNLIDSKVSIGDLKIEDLELKTNFNTLANIIEINPNSIVTNHLIEKLSNEYTHFVPNVAENLCKVAVIDRYHSEKEIGLGIVKGLNLIEGAIATTIAHDSHQLIVAGMNDNDMYLAIKTIEEMNGGIVVVASGKVIAKLSLPIGGLMSNQSAEEVEAGLYQIEKSLLQIRPNNTFNAFLTLSFLALPVIPSIKLTTKGLFNVNEFKFIPVFPGE
ncbi:adenine deaminase [Gottfriedia luciferensis]|uniref:Adenine deaminase n=1 Tax=Gottfriedia luciferensis TaxID=178774 RepID=A0ABX2ZYX4_9BACI|nr:adenine deaminase [Gottfriedia luciferensis]ODG93835.1 adenine deaminase [Gottfriedia luciferensis]